MEFFSTLVTKSFV